MGDLVMIDETLLKDDKKEEDVVAPDTGWYNTYKDNISQLQDKVDVETNLPPSVSMNNNFGENAKIELGTYVQDNTDKLADYHKKAQTYATYEGQQQFDVEKSNFISIISETFPSFEIFDEARIAAVDGKDSFTGSDGADYAIPAVMMTKQEKPWYYDNEGNVDLSQYADHTKAAQRGDNLPTEKNEDGEEVFSDLEYDDQVDNAELMDSLRRRHGSKTNAELLEIWASEQHNINYNITRLGYDAATLQNLTRQEKKDYLLQMETWDRVGSFGDKSQDFWDQLLEIAGALSKDLTTYVGFGTLGVGFFAKFGAKEVSKDALKLFLKQSVKERVKFTAKAGAVEGFFYGLSDSVLRQGIEQKAAEKITVLSDVELEATRTTLDTAAGTLGGGTLGGVLGYGAAKLSNSRNAADVVAESLVDDAAVKAVDTEQVQKVEAIEADAPVQKTAEVKQEFKEVAYDPLDSNLRKGRGSYKTTPLIFNNDVEKAVYFAGNVNKPSKHNAKYVAYAMKQLNMSSEDVQLLGKHMRAQIGKNLAARGGDATVPLKLDFSVIPKGKKVAIKAATKDNVDADVEVTAEKVAPTEQELQSAQQLIDAIDNVDPNAPLNPKDGAPINFERTYIYDLKASQGIMEHYKLTSDKALNADTERAAMKILMSFKSKDDVVKFLAKFEGGLDINTIHIDGTVARMIYASEATRLARALETAGTPIERLGVIINNEAHMHSVQAVATTVQRNSTAGGRFLQANNIKVTAVNDYLVNLIDASKAINKATEEGKAKGLEGDELTEFVEKAFSADDLKALEKEMDGLISEMDAHNKHQRGAGVSHSRDEDWVMKNQRILTEVWLASNLYNMATQTGAILGSLAKRSTMKGEAYIAWMLGKTFNSKDRAKWNEMRALQKGDFAKGIETLNMLFRMMKFGGQKSGTIMQVQSLDGYASRWDDHTDNGAINAAYLGFENPDNLLKRVVNQTLDKSGNAMRAPFTALSLADDVMKRIFYLPHIRSQATRQANELYPNDATAHSNHIEDMVAAYDIYYVKKGKRDSTVRIAYDKEMDQWKKDNPDADYDALKEAEFKAQESSEKLVEFTEDENILIKRVGIDDINHEKALAYVREMLFQTDIPVDSHTSVGRGLGALKKTRDVIPLLQTQFPYLKTVLNMTKDTLQRFPLTAAFSRDMRADIMAGGVRRDNAVAKLVMGSSITYAGKLLYEEGIITATTDFKDYQTSSATGVKGAMLNIPGTDTWIPLNRIEPYGSLLLLAANGMKMLDENKRIRAILEVAKADPEAIQDDLQLLKDMETNFLAIQGTLTMQMLTEKSGATGIKKLLAVLQNPDSKSSKQWIYQYTTGFIPAHSGFRQAFEGESSYEAKTFEEHMRKKLGIMAEKYGDRDTIDLLGEQNNDIQRIAGVHWRSSKPKVDLVLAELHKIRPGFRKSDGVMTIAGTGVVVELNYKQTYELNSLMSDPEVNVRKEIFKLTMDPAYQGLPDGVPGESIGKYPTKVTELRRVYGLAKQAAQGLYLSRHKKEVEKIIQSSVNLFKIQKNIGIEETSTDKNTSAILKLMRGE